MASVAIRLGSVVDWPAFSRAVRALRDEGVGPDAVCWRITGEHDGRELDLFAGDGAVERRAEDLASTSAMSLPRSFVDAAREVFLHADPRRLPLIHRLALRIADDARAWDDPLHEDRLQFERFRREVKREIHKMHAFVRFRLLDEPQAERIGVESDARFELESGAEPELEFGSNANANANANSNANANANANAETETETETNATDADSAVTSTSARSADPAGVRHATRTDLPTTRHVAWFEPGHHVLEAAAPFFARRFATMRWAILTPRASVEWNGRVLAFGPGARREEAPPADAGEALWLAYYRSIFNPARVKVAMMKKEMPVRFWKNLPEAATVSELLAQAPQRAQRMVDDGGTARTRRRGRMAAPQPASAGGAMGDSLEELARRASRCRDCPGADAATQTVFGEGGSQARVMIVGEQPGDHEDLRGRPFVGPAGTLLRGALAELGWPLDALYLTNAVKHFHHELRGKRRIHKTPGQQEAAACLHWLEAEIEALRPRAIVALGATAVRSLLGAGVAVMANEGRWLPRPDGAAVLVCLHPAAILRAEPERQADLRASWVATLSQATPFVLQELSGAARSVAPLAA